MLKRTHVRPASGSSIAAYAPRRATTVETLAGTLEAAPTLVPGNLSEIGAQNFVRGARTRAGQLEVRRSLEGLRELWLSQGERLAPWDGQLRYATAIARAALLLARARSSPSQRELEVTLDGTLRPSRGRAHPAMASADASALIQAAGLSLEVRHEIVSTKGWLELCLLADELSRCLIVFTADTVHHYLVVDAGFAGTELGALDPELVRTLTALGRGDPRAFRPAALLAEAVYLRRRALWAPEGPEPDPARAPAEFRAVRVWLSSPSLLLGGDRPDSVISVSPETSWQQVLLAAENLPTAPDAGPVRKGR